MPLSDEGLARLLAQDREDAARWEEDHPDGVISPEEIASMNEYGEFHNGE